MTNGFVFFHHPSDLPSLRQMSEMWRFISVVTGLSNVRRYGTVPVLRDQSSADHTGRCVMWGFQVAAEFGLDSFMTMQLVKKLAIHDMHEAISGDAIWPTKHACIKMEQAFKQYETAIEHVTFGHLKHFDTSDTDPLCLLLASAIDSADCAIFCANEVQMGNLHLLPIMVNCMNALTSLESELRTHESYEQVNLLDPDKLLGSIFTRCKHLVETV